VVTTSAERTRERLQTTALRLFLEHGYDETTVAQVASAAGVSHMTFFRHFPTKESVVVDDPYDPLIAEAVAEQPSALPAFERVRAGLLSAWSRMPDLPQGETRDRVLLGLRHPTLRAAMVEGNRRTEAAIVAVLERSGVSHQDAVAAAGACLGALMATLVDWGTDPSTSLGARIVQCLNGLPRATTAQGQR
jgi:AcrR family transcriptional regulator